MRFAACLCILKCQLGSITGSLHFHTRRSRLNLRDHRNLERIRGQWSTFMIDIRGNRAEGAGILRALMAILVVFQDTHYTCLWTHRDP
ncbi:hypothetical protein DFJ58DRAFT_783805 [Suillus subalutaceus]|uniref:uncharacterized protein n=1 Tax=Suillus subalutaceus TaxID=48586 RepID=UPI001B882135|nr:uncharacterized protein DFJ58DRAFT_783805 [Suillus subalutaceus]KAG1856972.1 hypothetical protein DFJ58DRAFT_783805 [Suillus subalutaceus]